MPKKIIVCGDSAGGNLAAALTVLAIKERVRVPDGVLLSYPALNLEGKTAFTPSMLISMEDECKCAHVRMFRNKCFHIPS